jgi:hypothetical protein
MGVRIGSPFHAELELAHVQDRYVRQSFRVIPDTTSADGAKISSTTERLRETEQND